MSLFFKNYLHGYSEESLEILKQAKQIIKIVHESPHWLIKDDLGHGHMNNNKKREV